MHSNWQNAASIVLRRELITKNLTYNDLVIKLAAIGVIETPGSLSVKIRRGKFQFSFFLQCAAAIGLKNLRLDDIVEMPIESAGG